MNNSIEEAYCSFEVSKLLKEKGFKQPTLYYYFEDGVFVKNSYRDTIGMDYGREFEIEYEELLGNWNDNFVTEKNGDRCFGCDKSKGYFETYSAPTHALVIEWLRVNFGMYIDIRQNSISEGNYFLYIKQCIKPFHTLYASNKYYSTPQEATEAALLYVLKELI